MSSNNHKRRLAALAEALRLSRTPSPYSIAERIGEQYDLHPGDILAEAERLQALAEPNATVERMTEIIAEEMGITVEELKAQSADMLEGIDV